MYLPSLLHITLLPGVVHSFSGGWTPLPSLRRTRQHREQHPTPVCRSAATAASRRQQQQQRQQLRLMPNEYEAFFNKASKLGADATRNLAPEERARRAMEGEKVEDDIIEIATVLRERADEMVAETGAINFEVIQPMIDEIAVLKSKYKVLMGASEESIDGDNSNSNSSSSDTADHGEEDSSSP